MTAYRVSVSLAAAAFAVAIAAFLYLCFADTYEGTSVSGATVTHTSSTMIEENGAGVLWVLALPVALAGIALLFSLGRSGWSGAGLWVTAVLSSGFVVVAILSVGFLYAPTALLLIASAVAHRREGGRQLVAEIG